VTQPDPTRPMDGPDPCPTLALWAHWLSETMLKSRVAAAYTSDFPDVKFRLAALKRYRRRQSGSGIRTIIRIGLKSQ